MSESTHNYSGIYALGAIIGGISAILIPFIWILSGVEICRILVGKSTESWYGNRFVSGAMMGITVIAIITFLIGFMIGLLIL